MLCVSIIGHLTYSHIIKYNIITNILLYSMRNIYKGYFNQSDFDANSYTFSNSNNSQFQAICVPIVKYLPIIIITKKII